MILLGHTIHPLRPLVKFFLHPIRYTPCQESDQRRKSLDMHVNQAQRQSTCNQLKIIIRSFYRMDKWDLLNITTAQSAGISPKKDVRASDGETPVRDFWNVGYPLMPLLSGPKNTRQIHLSKNYSKEPCAKKSQKNYTKMNVKTRWFPYIKA